jgi:hypothetical protein
LPIVDCRFIVSIGNRQSEIENNLSTCPTYNAHWFVNKRVTTFFYFLKVALIQGVDAAIVWSLRVNSTLKKSIRELLEKRTFEEDFATRATAIALSLPQFELLGGRLFTKI